ncbi:MAG: cyoE [Acidobacteriales bacterium]|nr:cyoE [Terriglobales bacterium]
MNTPIPNPGVDDTIRGVAPTRTVGETYAPAPVSRTTDVITLFKLRVTSMIILTAWAGYYMAARKHGLPPMSLQLLFTLVGVAMVASAAAALNQVIERDADGRMVRTKDRPLPTKRLTVRFGYTIAVVTGIVGICLLWSFANLLTAGLALLTAFFYAYVYTPLKPIAPISTFVGAFPGAMPAVLGWTAASGKIEWESLALFGIVFFWQFPHFLAIAWLYREDYERAGIRMLPVLDRTGKRTVFEILCYGAALIPVSLAPVYLKMSGQMYLIGALLLGLAYLAFGVRLAILNLPPSAAHSKKHARHLLQASVIYLPLLLALLMINGASR